MNEIEIVRKFVHDERDKYLKLLKLIKNACKEAEEELGHGVVFRVYSRGDKQGENGELKDTEKIFAACQRPINTLRLKAVEDIIGVTIVVLYPDQIDRTLQVVRNKLPKTQFMTPKPKAKHGTYFATHQVVKWTSPGNNIHCEIQCKTMLHDAWAVKMHDLTYKPQGSLDQRVKDLIETISGTLEGLEQQSQIVRNMITARQTIERRPFQKSLEALYVGVSEVLAQDWSDGQNDPELCRIRKVLEEKSEHLRTCPKTDRLLAEMAEAISAAAKDTARLRGAWLLAVRLAGFRADSQFRSFLEDQVEAVMDTLVHWRATGFLTDREVGAIPLGFYVIQDFTRALEYTDRILDLADEIRLGEHRRTIMRLNKLGWLLERESLKPSKPERREDLYQSVKKGLDELDKALEGLPPKESEELRPFLRGTKAVLEIVFGESKEVVRWGLEEYLAALAVDTPQSETEKEVAAAYSEWRTQVGWRRYFDLAEKEP